MHIYIYIYIYIFINSRQSHHITTCLTSHHNFIAAPPQTQPHDHVHRTKMHEFPRAVLDDVSKNYPPWDHLSTTIPWDSSAIKPFIQVCQRRMASSLNGHGTLGGYVCLEFAIKKSLNLRGTHIHGHTQMSSEVSEISMKYHLCDIYIIYIYIYNIDLSHSTEIKSRLHELAWFIPWFTRHGSPSAPWRLRRCGVAVPRTVVVRWVGRWLTMPASRSRKASDFFLNPLVI